MIIDHFWGSASTSYTGEVMRYLWAPHMNAGETSLLLSYEYIYGTPNLAQVNWTLVDHQNSIRDVVRATSDTNLQHVGHHVFDSFGNITWVFNANTGGAFSGDAAKANALGRYLYMSQEWDAVIDAYHYSGGGSGVYAIGANVGGNAGKTDGRPHGFYDPFTGKFISNDVFENGDSNLSRYVGNNPMNATDPTGLRAPTAPGPVAPSGAPGTGANPGGTPMPLPNTPMTPADGRIKPGDIFYDPVIEKYRRQRAKEEHRAVQEAIVADGRKRGMSDVTLRQWFYDHEHYKGNALLDLWTAQFKPKKQPVIDEEKLKKEVDAYLDEKKKEIIGKLKKINFRKINPCKDNIIAGPYGALTQIMAAERKAQHPQRSFFDGHEASESIRCL